MSARSAQLGDGTAEEAERLIPAQDARTASPSPLGSSQGTARTTEADAGSSQPPAPTLVIPVSSERRASSDKASGERRSSSDKGGTDKTSTSGASASSPVSAASPPSTSSACDACLLCRICLEDDAKDNLISPCGCTGTQRYAHRECIQKWINEKGHLRCEICDQQYQGDFTVPPPPPPTSQIPLFASIRIDDGLHDRDSLDLLDDGDQYHTRNPAASWCFTFVIFLLFLVVLHHTMRIADGMDYSDGSAGGGGSAGGDRDDDGSDADQYATSLTLFLFWVGTKAFLIGIPLYTVMRIASRQAHREQYEAYVRANAFDSNNRRVVFRVRRASAGVNNVPAGVV